MHNTLKNERLSLGISQQQLAKKVGISRPAVSNIERGKVIPSGDLLLKIAQVIGKPAEQIFFTNTVIQEAQSNDV